MPQEKHPREIDWAKLIEAALTSPGSLGETYSRFYNYSYLNQIYLRMQGVAEPVATMRRWNAIGRTVLKGSRAKEIIRPIFVQEKNEHDEVEERMVGFKAVKCIFTLSETEGDELPPVALLEWDAETALTRLNIRRVPFTELNGNIQGVSRGREIAINPVAVHPVKTLAHELGHVVLGHTLPERLAEYAAHRGVMEFQAEATAYLTMNELERLDEETAARSRGYIQSWLEGDRPSDRAVREVFTATDRILKAGRIAIGGGTKEAGQP